MRTNRSPHKWGLIGVRNLLRYRTVSVKMKRRPTCRRRHRRRWRGPEPRALRNRRTAAAAPRTQPPGTPSTGTGRVTSETDNAGRYQWRRGKKITNFWVRQREFQTLEQAAGKNLDARRKQKEIGKRCRQSSNSEEVISYMKRENQFLSKEKWDFIWLISRKRSVHPVLKLDFMSHNNGVPLRIWTQRKIHLPIQRRYFLSFKKPKNRFRRPCSLHCHPFRLN